MLIDIISKQMKKSVITIIIYNIKNRKYGMVKLI